MPQVYNRRHSDYSSSQSQSQRPGLEPRRRSSFIPSPPRPRSSSQSRTAAGNGGGLNGLTDADDSIVLSDLVRTGEASRLRRRGAMRIDHQHANRISNAQNPSSLSMSTTLPIPAVPTTSGSSATSSTSLTTPPYARPPYTSGPNPSRAPVYPWEPPSGEDPYNYGATEWREFYSSGGPMLNVANIENEPPPAGAGMITAANAANGQDEDLQERGYILFCGGEVSRNGSKAGEDVTMDLRSGSSIFTPSLFPVFPPQSSSISDPTGSKGKQRNAKSTNGCGAIIHFRAFPQGGRNVWVGKEEAAETVVGMDSAYFERTIVAKMMKSACGCIREGVGCAVCGKTLGTRYMPCQAASEGIFSNPSSAQNPCHSRSSSLRRNRPPLRPSGPGYWSARPLATSPRERGKFFVYTFFADHVTSDPVCPPSLLVPPPYPTDPSATRRYSSSLIDFAVPPQPAQTRITDYNFYRAPQLPRLPSVGGGRPNRDSVAQATERMQSYAMRSLAALRMTRTASSLGAGPSNTGLSSVEASAAALASSRPVEAIPGTPYPEPSASQPNPVGLDAPGVYEGVSSRTAEPPTDPTGNARSLWLTYTLSASPRPISPPLPPTDAPPTVEHGELRPQPETPFLFDQPYSPTAETSPSSPEFALIPPPSMYPLTVSEPSSPPPRMEVEVSVERRVEEEGRSGEGVDGMDCIELDADGVPIVSESSGDKVESAPSNGGHASGWVVSGR